MDQGSFRAAVFARDRVPVNSKFANSLQLEDTSSGNSPRSADLEKEAGWRVGSLKTLQRVGSLADTWDWNAITPTRRESRPCI